MVEQRELRIAKLGESTSEAKAFNWAGNSIGELALRASQEFDNLTIGHIHRTRVEYGKGSSVPLYANGKEIDGKTPDPSGGLYFTSDEAGNVAVYTVASGINVEDAKKIAAIAKNTNN